MIVIHERPRYDWALDAWIRERRERWGGKDTAFYNCAAWRRLRAHVLAEFHGESQLELKWSPARYVPANVVHHEMHLDKFPGWGLSEFAVLDGEVIRNLTPLSYEAHDIVHHRFGKGQRQKVEPVTVEMW